MQFKLDKQQSAIVNSNESNICVIAGAGSGKTRVLTERVRTLLERGEDPASFVCITFTKLAATEMKARLSGILGTQKMFIGTIHSLAYKMLGKSMELLTEDKQRQLGRIIVEKYGKDLTLPVYDEYCKKRELQAKGYLKNSEVKSILTTSQAVELLFILDEKDVTSLYGLVKKQDLETVAKMILDKQSEASLTKQFPETVISLAEKHGIISFDKLLDIVTSKRGGNKIKYLFVDEFQDVGLFEYRFLMGLKAENVFVVGDDYQCQPSSTRVLMANGERKRIDDVKEGDEVISFDVESNKVSKSTITAVQVCKCDSLIQVRDVCGLVSNYTPNHMCIVKRNDELITTRADDLMLSDILITIHNKEVISEHEICSLSKQSTLGYMDDTVISLEVYPDNCYFGDDILTHNSIYGFKGSDFEYFKNIAKNPNFKTYFMENNYRSSSKIVKYGESIISQINDVIPKKLVSKTSTSNMSTVIEDTGYLNTVKKYLEFIDERDYGSWFVLTRGNDDLVDISRLCYRLNIPTVSFKKSQLTKEELDEALKRNSIKLLTIHSAKGLEADNVLLYGDFPSPKKNNMPYYHHVGSEECRIFYVGATRARKNLVVVCKPIEE